MTVVQCWALYRNSVFSSFVYNFNLTFSQDYNSKENQHFEADDYYFKKRIET